MPGKVYTGLNCPKMIFSSKKKLNMRGPLETHCVVNKSDAIWNQGQKKQNLILKW